MDEILPPAATADERRTGHAGALAEITKAIGASLNFGELQAIQRLVHGMFAQAILLVLLFQGEPELVGDYRRNELYAYLSYPAAQSLTSSQAWPPASFSFGRELTANRPAVVDDLVLTADEYGGDRALLGLGRSALVVPLHTQQRILGGLVLISSAPGAYKTDDMGRAQAVANLATTTLEHHRLNRLSEPRCSSRRAQPSRREIHDTSPTHLPASFSISRPSNPMRSAGARRMPRC